MDIFFSCGLEEKQNICSGTTFLESKWNAARVRPFLNGGSKLLEFFSEEFGKNSSLKYFFYFQLAYN